MGSIPGEGNSSQNCYIVWIGRQKKRKRGPFLKQLLDLSKRNHPIDFSKSKMDKVIQKVSKTFVAVKILKQTIWKINILLDPVLAFFRIQRLSFFARIALQGFFDILLKYNFIASRTSVRVTAISRNRIAPEFFLLKNKFFAESSSGQIFNSNFLFKNGGWNTTSLSASTTTTLLPPATTAATTTTTDLKKPAVWVSSTFGVSLISFLAPDQPKNVFNLT